MKFFQFSKPKTPGFGLSRDFYQTVLSTKPVLPSLWDLVNPEGEGGAMPGFGVPLAAGKTKDSLKQPLERGKYGIFSKDKKTCLEMMVMSAQEAGFDPDAFARTAMALQVPEDVLTRIRATWSIAQFRFESHDPMVYPALDALQSVTGRLAHLCDGVIADPLAHRYLLPGQLRQANRLDPRVDAREHVSTWASKVGSRYTQGLRKFAEPELEMPDVPESHMELAESFLILAAQKVLTGDSIRHGDKLGAPRLAFEALPGGHDRARWDGIAVLELIPASGVSVADALAAWVESGSR